MADSDPEPEKRQYLSSSIFNIPGYLAKSLPDFESIRSPTSPLDLGVFSSFRKPRFARSSSERAHRKKDPNGNRVVGLGIIVNSLPDPARPNKNIIFGPQVRPNGPNFLGSFRRYGGAIDSSLRSKSLPTNYVETAEIEASVPIQIVGALSVREIELSEDYTCIISHGPNPKTIHIFGDCVLECHATESNCFRNDEDRSRAAENLDRSSDPVQVLTFCFGCNKKLERGEEIYIGDKAFCGFDCCSGNISEDETEEDLFLLGMPITM